MVIAPSSQDEYATLAAFLRHRAQVRLSEDLRMIGWLTREGLQIVVGFNSFVGRTCHMHVAMREGYRFTPRAMLRACFGYAFEQAGCQVVFGMVNSKNEAAMRYNRHLGFVERLRYPGLHDDGGDLVLFEMRRESCRYLEANHDSHPLS